MMYLRRLAPIFLVLAMPFVAQSASAQTIAPADRAAIGDRITAFDTLMKEGRVAESLDFIPPRLLAAMARKFGFSDTKMKALLAEQVSKSANAVTFLSFAMDMAAAKVDVTPDGKRTYMLIPTETVIAVPDAGKVRSNTSTLALKDEGQWYLIRIDSAQQIILLRDAYPEFTGVDFPSGSSAAVD